MSRLIVYYFDNTTGQIVATGITNVEDVKEIDGGPWTVGVGETDPAKEYVDVSTKQIIPRPECAVQTDKLEVRADGVDFVRLTSVAPSATVEVQGPRIRRKLPSVPDGVVDLTFDRPGKYVVKVSKFPEQDKEVEVDAV